PANVSSTTANQNSESNGAVLPFGGMPMGNANSFTEPARMNMNAATMRSALRSCGAQVDHFATMLGAVMRSSPQSWIASYSEPSFYRHDERGWANSTPLRDRCLAAALQQASVSQALRPPGECVGGAAPLELGRVAEQRRVGPERRQVFEEQRQVSLVPEHARREVFDDPVLVQEPGRRSRTDPRNARISVCGVADEGEVVGNQGGLHPEFRANACGVPDLLPPAINLYDPVAANALRQVLVARQDADLFHRLIAGGDVCCGGERVVRLQLDHRPDRA